MYQLVHIKSQMDNVYAKSNNVKNTTTECRRDDSCETLDWPYVSWACVTGPGDLSWSKILLYSIPLAWSTKATYNGVLIKFMHGTIVIMYTLKADPWYWYIKVYVYIIWKWYNTGIYWEYTTVDSKSNVQTHSSVQERVNNVCSKIIQKAFS